MGKDPAVLLYTSDLLTGMTLLNMEERGQYITLLCQQHQLGHLPENHMISVCNSNDSQVIKKFIKDKDGNYYNKRMETEIINRREYCNSRSHKGLSGRKKKNHMKTVRKSYGNHIENENEDKNKDIFNSFRKKYPGSKRGNETEFKYFKKHNDWKQILPLLESVIEKQVEHKKYLKNTNKFCAEWKNLKTWIYNRCWEEEIPEYQKEEKWF